MMSIVLSELSPKRDGPSVEVRDARTFTNIDETVAATSCLRAVFAR
jgi:hypothetical protein